MGKKKVFEEWFDTIKKPTHFSLCELDTGTMIIKGWWTGYNWEGAKYNGQKIIKWRPCNELKNFNRKNDFTEKRL